MQSLLRCKLRVTDVMRRIAANGEVESEQVKLCAVYGDRNTANGIWSKFTPSANFEIWITNPSAIGILTRDHEFFVDFTPGSEQDPVVEKLLSALKQKSEQER